MPQGVYISHSRSDNAWCDTFVRALRPFNIEIWYDEQGEYAGWVQTTKDALQSKQIFIVVLSLTAWGSEWVREEINYAFLFHRTIIGLVIGKPPLTGEIVGAELLDITNLEAGVVAKMLADQLGFVSER